MALFREHASQDDPGVHDGAAWAKGMLSSPAEGGNPTCGAGAMLQ